ncbi:MAG: ThiF family adenylyltransferase [bacterium]
MDIIPKTLKKQISISKKDKEDEDKERYSRLETIHGWKQGVVKNSTALIGGVGAIGNEVAKNLALIGCGKILLVDKEIIELSNLTRSIMFRQRDIGRSKVEVVAEQIKEVNPDVKVATFHGNIASLGLGVLRRMDLIFCDFDSRLPRIILNDACIRVKKPWIDAGLNDVNVLRGAVTVFDVPAGACYACSLSSEMVKEILEKGTGRGVICAEIERESEKRGFVPSTPMMASLIGALQVQEGLKILMNNEEITPLLNKIIHIDTQDHKMEVFTRRRNPKCLIHQIRSPIPEKDIIEVKEFNSNSTTIGELLEKVKKDLGKKARISLWYDLVISASCPNCKKTEKVYQSPYVFIEHQSCSHCGTPQEIAKSVSELDENVDFLNLTLTQGGLRQLDILEAVIDDGKKSISKFYELTGDEMEVMNFE